MALLRTGWTDDDLRALVAKTRLIGDCLKPMTEWDNIRRALDARMRTDKAFRHSHVERQWAMKGTGYLFAISRWPFATFVPDDPYEEDLNLIARSAPQVLMTAPRTAEEYAFVYALMEDFGLVLQRCRETGYRNVTAKGIGARDLLLRYASMGGCADLASVREGTVETSDAGELEAYIGERKRLRMEWRKMARNHRSVTQPS